jgi:hypothetical protein
MDDHVFINDCLLRYQQSLIETDVSGNLTMLKNMRNILHG